MNCFKQGFFCDKKYLLFIDSNVIRLQDMDGKKNDQIKVNLNTRIEWIVEKKHKLVVHQGQKKIKLLIDQQDSFKIFQSIGNTIIHTNVTSIFTMFILIGQGSYSKVYRINCLLDNKDYACKILTDSMIKKSVNVFQTKKIYRLIQYQGHHLTEANILKLLNHPNIVKYYGHFLEDKASYLLTEYYEGQTLTQSMNTIDSVNTMKKLLSAIHYLHSQGIVHRDLKPDNILVTDEKVILIDFGLAAFVKNLANQNLCCGTKGYIAPEIMDQQYYDEQSDIFSLGIIFFHIIFGYPKIKVNQLFYSIDLLALNLRTPQYMVDLIKRMLNPNRFERISAYDALQLINNSDTAQAQKPRISITKRSLL